MKPSFFQPSSKAKLYKGCASFMFKTAIIIFYSKTVPSLNHSLSEEEKAKNDYINVFEDLPTKSDSKTEVDIRQRFEHKDKISFQYH